MVASKKLKLLTKEPAKRVMGIDCSTHALAFTIFENRRPVKWGKINFEGADVFERLSDAVYKVRAVKDELSVDYIVFEGAILAKVQNADVTIKLAMVYGAVIAELRSTGTRVVTIKPTEWQFYIGNKNWTKAQKEALKVEVPNKSASWYSGEIRERRKQFTMDYFNKKWPHMNLSDNDVGDSCGLAYYGYHHLTAR